MALFCVVGLLQGSALYVASLHPYIKAATMANVIRVSAKSRSTAVAGAVAGIMREEGFAEMKAIGASAVNQSVKALAITRSYLKEDNIDIAAVPSFTEVTIEGVERTAVHMAIYPPGGSDCPGSAQEGPGKQGRRSEGSSRGPHYHFSVNRGA